MDTAGKTSLKNKHLHNFDYLTIRPVARKGYGSIAHEAKPNGLLIRGPWGLAFYNVSKEPCNWICLSAVKLKINGWMLKYSSKR